LVRIIITDTRRSGNEEICAFSGRKKSSGRIKTAHDAERREEKKRKQGRKKRRKKKMKEKEIRK
jgi:hypothetical protein